MLWTSGAYEDCWASNDNSFILMLKCGGQVQHLTLLGNIARLDDNADAKKILTAFPPEDFKRLPEALGSHV